MVLDTIMIIICFVGASFLVIQQIFYIYNEMPYLDMMKSPQVESHYGICMTKNENKVVSLIYYSI